MDSPGQSPNQAMNEGSATATNLDRQEWRTEASLDVGRPENAPRNETLVRTRFSDLRVAPESMSLGLSAWAPARSSSRVMGVAEYRRGCCPQAEADEVTAQRRGQKLSESPSLRLDIAHQS